MSESVKSKKEKLLKLFMTITCCVISAVFFLFGLVAIIPKMDFLEIKSEDAIQWFIFSVVVLLVPFIQEVSFKGLTVKMNEFKQMKTSLENLSESTRKMMDNLNNSRSELISGYKKYLDSLPEEERFEKVKIQTDNYLKELKISVGEIENNLTKLNFYKEGITNQLTKELVKSLQAYQESRGQIPDGILGYFTWNSILDDLKKYEASNAIP